MDGTNSSGTFLRSASRTQCAFHPNCRRSCWTLSYRLSSQRYEKAPSPTTTSTSHFSICSRRLPNRGVRPRISASKNIIDATFSLSVCRRVIIRNVSSYAYFYVSCSQYSFFVVVTLLDVSEYKYNQLSLENRQHVCMYVSAPVRKQL